MKFSRMVAGLVLPLTMAACASFPGTTDYLETLKATTPSGPAFTQALSHEYAAFASSEREKYDWFHSWHFARKGLAASQGTVVAPENPEDWSFADPQAATALQAAHARLITVLGTNAPSRVPALTATAQVKFDCWVEEQDEGWQTDAIAACRNPFLAAMDAIEAQVAKPLPAPVAAAEKPAIKQAADRFIVFFDTNQAKLPPEALVTVQELAKAVKAAGYPKLDVTGYTDTVGSAEYNTRLSLHRAEALRKALIAAGVPADRLTAEGKGKADLLVPTKDGVAEPQNRRASVRFPG